MKRALKYGCLIFIGFVLTGSGVLYFLARTSKPLPLTKEALAS